MYLVTIRNMTSENVREIHDWNPLGSLHSHRVTQAEGKRCSPSPLSYIICTILGNGYGNRTLIGIVNRVVWIHTICWRPTYAYLCGKISGPKYIPNMAFGYRTDTKGRSWFISLIADFKGNIWYRPVQFQWAMGPTIYLRGQATLGTSGYSLQSHVATVNWCYRVEEAWFASSNLSHQ